MAQGLLSRGRELLRFGRVAGRASGVLSVLTLVTMAVGALAPVLSVAAIGAVVARVPHVVAQGYDSAAGRMATIWALVAGSLFLLQWSAGALHGAAASALGERIDAILQRDLMAVVMTPVGIAHLEDAATLDLINTGRDTFRAPFSRPGRLVTHISGLVSGRIVLAGACLLVARFHPVLGLALLSAGLWAAYEDKVASRVEATHHHGGTEHARRTDYYHELGTWPRAAKEVRVFGLGGFLYERFVDSWERSMVEVLAPGGRRPLVSTAALGLVSMTGLVVIGREAVAGRVGPGEAVVYAQAFAIGLGGVRTSSWAGLNTELSLATFARYEQARAAVEGKLGVEPVGELAVRDGPLHEIRFEGVSFTYPGTDHLVLRDFDLTIPAGTSLAVVGANGAGKTTLVKLLCRLYDPDGGRITIDGVDLRDLDPPTWRARVAAVFQDSLRLELPARLNVGFGRPEAADDLQAVRAAAETAGVADVVAALPNGWNTPLSAEYAGGADLSGGEWQKLGLARALFAVRHGADVLVLDEPAAHFDARAEADLYARFLVITEGVTTIVISHRFSTVRQASTIVVVDEGRIVEQGSHAELLAAGGRYAEMFQLQASRFASDVGVSES